MEDFLEPSNVFCIQPLPDVLVRCYSSVFAVNHKLYFYITIHDKLTIAS